MAGKRIVMPGAPTPIGATAGGKGTNFSLFSDNAEAVTLCLFSDDGTRELERIPVTSCTNGLWHCHLPGVGPGQVYGYRVKGPWSPNDGHRFNDSKLLLDPYAAELVGEIKWDDALFGHVVSGDPDCDLKMDLRDSAPFVPKARVGGAGPLTETARPHVPWPKTIIYEAHVRGLTMRHPLVRDAAGTFAALSAPPVLEHLKRIGITAIELLPVHAFAQDKHLLDRGLKNYWGYNTLAFFAPEPSYLASGRTEEVARAVDRMHDAGIEVILDVVFNHSCEGNQLGPTLSWRGLDNSSYYWLNPENKRYYEDFTGCGSSFNLTHSRVLQMVMDSLRYWVIHYGVDGFRFDLGATLGRDEDGFTPKHPFFMAALQDPTLNGVKLIAEPWDVAPGGYQLGNFPPGFSEWNGDYRDKVRQFWNGAEGKLPGFAGRFAASRDLFAEGRRRPWSSVNFVAVHDGFVLTDLVSYNHKHNEANGEDNRDGASNNHSWNCGAEGDTDDTNILQVREKQKMNLLATLLLSQGVPMLLAGDEFGNTQSGNNNAYCQDNEIGWLSWDRFDDALVEFVARLSAMRKQRSALSRPEFLTGARNSLGQPDVSWFSSTGNSMSAEEWNRPDVKCLTVRLAPMTDGQPLLLVAFNASHVDVPFTVPASDAKRWRVLLDTARLDDADSFATGEQMTMSARSLRVLESVE